MNRKLLVAVVSASALAVVVAAWAKPPAQVSLAANNPRPAAVNLAPVTPVKSAPREEITGALQPAKGLSIGLSLSDVAIKRPVFTSMMALCLIVLGMMGAKRLGTDLFPEVTFPVVIVTTVVDEQNDAFGSAFALAFVFIFMVLASQFESLKHPITIMVSLPLALIGALLALLVTGRHLSLGAMIGVILLMGLVTKNAILLVDGALQRLREGDDVDTALMKAGPRRLRPILMTSFAMAIGMVPTALGTGVGSEFRSPMAIAVIGGVITSTALTLLVVPVIFAGVEKLSLVRLSERLFRRNAQQPVLVSATPQTEAVARTVNG